MDQEIVVRHLANSTLAGREDRFNKSAVAIGRGEASDIGFDQNQDSLVSHHHAEISLHNGELFLRDLGSRNGTYVNQQRITKPTRIGASDSVMLGGADGPLLQIFLAGAGEDDVSTSIGVMRNPTENVASATLSKSGLGKSSGRNRVVAGTSGPLAEPSQEGMGADAFIRVLDHALDHRSRKPSRALAFVMLLLGFCAGTGFGTFYLTDTFKKTKPPGAEIDVEDMPIHAIASLGRLEPSGGMIGVATPPGEILQSVSVQEGQIIAKGEEVARLQSYDQIAREVALAESNLRAATSQTSESGEYGRALVEEAKQGIKATEDLLDLQVKAQEAQIAVHRNSYETAVKDRDNLEKMNLQDTSDQLTRLRKVEDGARLQLSAAESLLSQMLVSNALKREQAKAQLQTALANQRRLESTASVDIASKSLDKAKSALERAVVHAPRAGQVLKILSHPGEAPNGRPILQLGDTRQFQVMVEVFENNLKKIEPGANAVVRSPALPGELHGKVAQILWTVKHHALTDLDPSAEQDLRVVNVRIDLDPKETGPIQELLSRLLNLEVNVWIDEKS